jgi:NADH-quinone oxidoreductase subunit A
VAFLFPWAATITYTGITGYTIALIFLVILTVGFIYEVVKGSLNAQ